MRAFTQTVTYNIRIHIIMYVRTFETFILIFVYRNSGIFSGWLEDSLIDVCIMSKIEHVR